MGLIFGVRSEKSLGGEAHLVLFFRGNADKGGSLLPRVAAIFNLGEENLLIFNRNEVDFVGFGLEIVGDNGVVLPFKVASDR